MTHLQNVALETVRFLIVSHLDRGDGASVMDDAETPLNNSGGSTFDCSDMETPGSLSTPATISPGSIVCNAQCCYLANPAQMRDKDAIRSTQKLQGKKWWQFSH